MRQGIKNWLQASVVCRLLSSLGNKISAFMAEGFLWRWLTREPIPDGNTRTDRLFRRIVDGKFCEFLRSGFLFSLLMRIPELPWIFLMLTLFAAMALPTLVVMLLSLMTLALTLLALIFRKEQLPPVTGGINMWILFALMTLLYTFVNFGGMQGILAGGIRFCMLPLLPCAWVLLHRKKRVWRTVYAFAGASFAVGMYGMYQYFTGALSAKWTDIDLFSESFGRLVSTFENPNVYGTFLLIALPVVLVAAIVARGWRGKTFLWVTAALLTVNLFLTYSRGCYLAVVISLFVLLVCKGRGWLWVGAGALALSPFYLPESVLSRIASIGNLGDSSVSYRINIWKGSLAMLEKYWWMGVGIGDGAFRSIYENFALGAVEDAPHAHNLALQTMAESGVLGLLVLILLFACLFRTACSAVKRSVGADKWLRLSLIAAWCGLLFQGITDYIFYNNNLFAIMMISLGVMITGIPQRKEEDQHEG
ncbi:MAG: O-antigen ligase family protein [Clostridia bacterium]|nr:O-antigen ligase family protein [Clostridia bacterium]